MATCSTNCASILSKYIIDNCNLKNTAGGINRLVFVTCDATLPTDPCDDVSWLALAVQGKLRASGEIMGSQPKASYDKKRLSSCKPEQVTGGTLTVDFMDYNNSESKLTHTFWNDIMTQPQKYLVAWVGCDGTITGFVPFSAEISYVKEDNIKGTSHFEGSLSVDLTSQTGLILAPFTNYSDLVTIATTYQNYDVSSALFITDQKIDCSQILVTDQNFTIDNDGVGVVNNINFTRITCTDTVSFTLDGLPAGVTYTAIPDAVSPALTTTTTITASIAAVPGTYFVTINASAPVCGASDGTMQLIIT